MNISNFIETQFPLDLMIENIPNDKKEDAIKYYYNSKSDAIFGYNSIKKYLKKNFQILEVGGGLHFLSFYLHYLGYSIFSLEPGNFQNYIDQMRINSKKVKIDLKIFDEYLEEFEKKNHEKFNFIYSINVLEHVKDIEKHLKISVKCLKNNDSKILIRCPNYNFPYESHFRSIFIPFFPLFTFEKLLRKKMIKKLSFEKYLNRINSINFECNYNKIKKLKLNIVFLNPIIDLMERVENDKVFENRIMSNKIIKVIYNLINFLKLKKLISLLCPKIFYPYLIIEIKK